MGIGAVSKAIGRSPDTLRRWEREGLIAPQRDGRGHRVYSVEDLERAYQLARMALRAQRRSIKLATYAGNEPIQLSLFRGSEQ
jgi:DNA-binding transcriptional MerR regulator